MLPQIYTSGVNVGWAILPAAAFQGGSLGKGEVRSRESRAESRRQPGLAAPRNVFISIIYAHTPLHLPDCYATLDSMTRFESQLGAVSALPGGIVLAFLRIGQVPRLLPIIIQVAVPGPRS